MALYEGYIGSPVNGIENFLPSIIPDLVLWIKASENFLLKETIQSYCNKQSYFVKESLHQQFANFLKYKVITEIKSDTPLTPNSLIPLNLNTEITTVFPTFRKVPGELDAINMSNYKDPITGKLHNLELVTSKPIIMDENASSYTISYGIKITQNSITNQLQIIAPFIENPLIDTTVDPTEPLELDPNKSILAADVKPTAEFSEIIVFSRALNLDENAKMEGYLAYKQNTQYALPINHPYLPNMISDPIFTYGSTFSDLEKSLRQQIVYINVATNDYINEKGNTGIVVNTPGYVQTIQIALNQIALYIPVLSKGYLYAKRINNLSLDGIYRAIKDKEFSKDEITDLSINEFIVLCKQIIIKSDEYITSLQTSYSHNFTQQSGGNLQTIEIANFTEQKNESQTFYTTLASKSRKIQSDGLIAYNSLQTLVKNTISNYAETIIHKFSDIKSINTKIMNLYEPIQKSILAGTWLTHLHTIDKSFTNIYENDLIVSITYNDPTLNLIQTYYTYVSNQIKTGDYAFILEEFKEINNIFIDFSEKEINPIYKETYLKYLGELIKKADDYYDHFKEISDIYTKFLNNINSFINVAKETGQITTFTDKIVNIKYYNICDIYIRKVIPLDETLFGLEYVETDMNGFIVNVKPFFLNNYTFINSVYMKPTPYIIDGIALTIKYCMLDPLTESVYNGIKNDDKIPVHLHTLTDLFEIPRYEMNAIQCIEATGSIPPILLPYESIEDASWCLIYNVGDTPIAVRSPENFVDAIGPNSGILYMYIKKDTIYGSYIWNSNQISYDSLLLSPRTNMSMYIDEIGTSIYIKQTKNGYKPVYTTDGFLSEVIAKENGQVYDIDDIYLSNPYSVKSVGLDQRINLVFDPSKKKMVKIAQQSFKVCQDSVSGYAIILNENGAVGINQYGFASAVRTPIQEIGEKYKIAGAYGDLNIQPTGAIIECPYDIEPFLKFNDLFTTSTIASTGEKNVYVTHLLNPIVNPNGIIVQTELTGSNTIQTTLPIDIYKPPTNADTSAMDRLTTTYNAAKNYIKYKIDTINKYTNELKPFGDDAVKLCTDAIIKYQESLNSLKNNDSVFETGVMTPLAMDTVKASIISILKDFFKLQKLNDESIKIYKTGIDQIKSVKDLVKYWNDHGAKIMDSTVSKINQDAQEILIKFQITAIPYLTELIASTSDALEDFNNTLKDCVNYSMTSPIYISEVNAWYLAIQPKLELLKTLNEDVKYIETTEIPKLALDYQTNQIYSGISNKIQGLFSNIQSIWSTIHDKKIALDTYLQGKNNLTPEQYKTLEFQVNDLESKLLIGDNTFNSLYKQMKTNPTENLYNSIEQFRLYVSVIQENIPKIPVSTQI